MNFYLSFGGISVIFLIAFGIAFAIAYSIYKYIYQPKYELEIAKTAAENDTCGKKYTSVVEENAANKTIWDKKYTDVVAENASTVSMWDKKYASVLSEKTDAEKKYSDLFQIIPNPTKVDRYWGCILAGDTPKDYKWATGDSKVGPLLIAAKMSLQSQLNVVRDNYPTAKFVAITQSYTSPTDSLYVLWGTDAPVEPKINSQHRRCLLPAKDGYVGCKGDTPILGCLGDVTLSGNTWIIYKIRD